MAERWNALADKCVHVVGLVIGSIPGGDLFEIYTVAKHKNKQLIID